MIDKIPNEYFVDFKVISNNETNTYKRELKFQITNRNEKVTITESDLVEMIKKIVETKLSEIDKEEIKEKEKKG